jgi:hypothetical protein
MAQKIASHPDASLPRIFEAALTGAVSDTENFTAKQAVQHALSCCIELLAIEDGRQT